MFRKGQNPWNKGMKGFRAGIPHTKEHSRKIGIANRLALKGRKLSSSHKESIAESMKGKHLNELNPSWKGDNVGYVGLHSWIRRHYGTREQCDKCGTTKKRMYHWANISGSYKRDRDDWIRVCVPCHKAFFTKHTT